MENQPPISHSEMPQSRLSPTAEWRRLIGFCIVGAGGFFVHAAMLFCLVEFTRVNHVLAWFPAFIVAVLFTWLANRFIAFKGLKSAPSKRAEAALYFFVQSLGAAINFVTYSALIIWAVPVLSHPIIALAMGSIAAFGFNYGALRLFVYKNNSEAKTPL